MLLALLPFHAPAQERGDAADDRLSAEVLWQMDRVGEPVVSPDGR
jgi:hypothetical protein